MNLYSPIMFVGDLHGKAHLLEGLDRAAIAMGCRTIIQLGDGGFFWPEKTKHGVGTDNCPMMAYFEKRRAKLFNADDIPDFLFCPGNHDNFDVLDLLHREQGYPDKFVMAPKLYGIARGATINVDGAEILFCGGAASIDKKDRIEGLSWWAREEPNQEELQRFADGLAQGPDIVVTHEAPIRVPIWKYARENDPTSRALDNILKITDYQPPYWFFGHHHILGMWYMTTQFYCGGLHGDYWVLGVDGQVRPSSDKAVEIIE